MPDELDKLADLSADVDREKHEEWVRNRLSPTPELITEALLILLDKFPDVTPEPGDELPPGYVPLRKRTIEPGSTTA